MSETKTTSSTTAGRIDPHDPVFDEFVDARDVGDTEGMERAARMMGPGDEYAEAQEERHADQRNLR